jgi:hypothetical protein
MTSTGSLLNKILYHREKFVDTNLCIVSELSVILSNTDCDCRDISEIISDYIHPQFLLSETFNDKVTEIYDFKEFLSFHRPIIGRKTNIPEIACFIYRTFPKNGRLNNFLYYRQQEFIDIEFWTSLLEFDDLCVAGLLIDSEGARFKFE